MVTDRFGALLEELGTVMNLKLAPDKFNSCLIRLPGPDTLEIVMKLSPSEEEILALIEIGPLPTGPYRLSLLKEALMSNAQTKAKGGIFCYGTKKDQLLLYQSIPNFDLTGRQLLEIITELCQTARHWKECLSKGELPQRYAPASNHNIFGIR